MYNMNIYIAKKYTNEKWRNEHYKLGKMENEIFYTCTLSFHLHIDRRRRIMTFIDDGKTITFFPTLGFESVYIDIWLFSKSVFHQGFSPFKHTFLGRDRVLL